MLAHGLCDFRARPRGEAFKVVDHQQRPAAGDGFRARQSVLDGREEHRLVVGGVGRDQCEAEVLREGVHSGALAAPHRPVQGDGRGVVEDQRP